MSNKEIKDLVLQVATEKARSGPGWAQEGVVLREVGERLSRGNGQPNLQVQQDILNAWHDLFFEKKLAWGYDLDNPNSPFFHVREAA
jgi:hypothetical protein